MSKPSDILVAAERAAADAYPIAAYPDSWQTRRADFELGFERGFKAGVQDATRPAGPATCAECHLTIPAGDYHYTFEFKRGTVTSKDL